MVCPVQVVFYAAKHFFLVWCSVITVTNDIRCVAKSDVIRCVAKSDDIRCVAKSDVIRCVAKSDVIRRVAKSDVIMPVSAFLPMPGYTGVQCETLIDTCLSHACKSGATCVNQHGRFYTCKCPPGVTGRLCDVSTD